MAFNVDYTPYGAYLDLANQGGAAVSRRANIDRTIGRQMETDQFNARFQQNESQFQQSRFDQQRREQMARAEAERNRMYDIQKMGYAAELQQQANYQRGIDEENRQVAYLQQQQLGQLEQEFDYSPEQQVELNRITESMNEIDSKEGSGKIDFEQARHLRQQAHRKRLAIRPKTPKKFALDDFPEVEFEGLGKFRMIPDANRGAPGFLNPMTGQFLHDREKELQAEADRKHNLAMQALKAESPEVLAAQKAMKEFELQTKREEAELQLFTNIASDMITKTLKDKMGDETLAFGDRNQALQAAKSVFDFYKKMQAEGQSAPAMIAPNKKARLQSLRQMHGDNIEMWPDSAKAEVRSLVGG